MADAKITELTAIDAVAGGDLIPIVDDPAGTPATKKATASQIKDYIIALANTWTATQTIDPADNTSALAVSGFSLTGSNAQSILDLAGTWNTTGTPTALKLNVTDTASNSASLLMDLQRGGSSQFSVRRDGYTVLGSALVGGATSTGVGIGYTSGAITLGSSVRIEFRSSGFNTPDTILTRRGAANLRLGAADAASPVAQTLSVQGCTGTDASASTYPFKISGATGTGTGVGGPIVLQTAPAGGSSGAAVNSLVDRLSVTGSGSVVVGNGANALTTTATDGFLYVPTCAGTPTGTPTTQTGTAPIVVDTTNNKLYFYSGGQWRDAGP